MTHKQWSVEWPEKDELQRMLNAGMTHREMAEQIGVSRQAVTMKLSALGIAKRVERMSHADYLPWEIAAEDHNDMIAHAMRAYSKQQQGGELNARQQAQVDKLFGFMDREGVVLTYDRDRGFYFKRRDPEIDRPGDPIRRPEQTSPRKNRQTKG